MESKSRRAVYAVLALALAMATLVGAGSPVDAAVAGDDFRGEDVELDLRWVPCYEDIGEFTGLEYECSWARVPLDYDKLDGGKIPLRLIRIPATGEKKGSLFFNPGGPGGSGVEIVLFAGDQILPEAREHYDYVGFDPRGVGMSNPLLCFGGFQGLIDAFSPIAFPTTDAELKEWRSADNGIRSKCKNRASNIINKMSTANVVRDLETLRAAVGDEQLQFLGYSYGTVIGQTYAEMFPDRVGRIIIDSVVNLRDWTGDPDGRSNSVVDERLDSSVGAQATFEEFQRLCEEAGPEACPLAPDTEARVDAIIEGLRAEPLTIVDEFGEFTITYADLISTTLSALYDPFSFPFLGFIWADVEFFQQGGEPSLSAGASFSQRYQQLQERVQLAPKTPPYPNFIEGFAGVICLDSSNPATYRQWQAAVDRADDAGQIFGAPWIWSSSICKGWPGTDQDRFVGPYGSDTANPILVVNNRYDPATPWEQAVAANDELANSALLTVEGWGHIAIGVGSSVCADAIAVDYLVNGVLPESGTTCPTEIDPFAVGPFGAAPAGEDTALLEVLRQARTPLNFGRPMS